MLVSEPTIPPTSPQRPVFPYHAAAVVDQPVVSIITPVSEINDLIALAQTVRNQSFTTWEWLIVCADPSIQHVVKAIAADEPRIRVLVETQAQTLASLRNTGCASARGTYLLHLDSWMLLDPTWIEKCVWALDADSSLVCCSTRSVNKADGQIWTRGFDGGDALLEDCPIVPAVLLPQRVHAHINGFDDSLSDGFELWDYWLRCLGTGGVGYTIPEPLCWHAQPALLSARVPPAAFETQQRVIQQRYDELRGHFHPARFAYPEPYEPMREDPPAPNLLRKLPGRHVLLLLPWMIVGGADRVNLDVMRYLGPHGYHFSIATTLIHENPWAGQFAEYTPDVFCLNRFLRVWDYPRFLVYLIRSRQIDTVMVANSYLGYQLLPYLRAQCPEVVFVDYTHSEEELWRNGGYPRCAVAYQEMLDLNITSTGYLRDWMIERGADPDRIAVCYTNVDTTKWRPLPEARSAIRQSLGVPDDTVLITFVGRLAPEKRPHLLAHIAHGLRTRGVARFLVLVIGDGPERGVLEDAIITLDVGDYVRILGRVEEEPLHQTVAASDILCLPSRKEGISVAIFEAMAMGVIPVSALVGGQAELVTPECGVLVPLNDDELATYVRAIKELIESPERRNEMSAAARQRVVEHFRIEQIGEQMDELLTQACNLATTAPREPLPLRLARETATQTIEQTRLELAIDEVWANRQQQHQQKEAQQAHAWWQQQLEDAQQARAWWQQQSEHWEAETIQQQKLLSEQQAWIAELERAVEWHKQQLGYWQAEATRQQAETAQLQADVEQLQQRQLSSRVRQLQANMVHFARSRRRDSE